MKTEPIRQKLLISSLYLNILTIYAIRTVNELSIIVIPIFVERTIPRVKNVYAIPNSTLFSRPQ